MSTSGYTIAEHQYPYKPAHVSMPKECRKIFLVTMAPEREWWRTHQESRPFPDIPYRNAGCSPQHEAPCNPYPRVLRQHAALRAPAQRYPSPSQSVSWAAAFADLSSRWAGAGTQCGVYNISEVWPCMPAYAVGQIDRRGLSRRALVTVISLTPQLFVQRQDLSRVGPHASHCPAQSLLLRRRRT